LRPATRRQWLLQTLAVAGVPAALWAAAANETDVPFDDERDFVAEAQPANPRVRNFDWRRSGSPRVAASDFFVFHQTTTPEIDLGKWRLHVGGLLSRPRMFGMAELLASGFTPLDFDVTFECAGNMPRKDSLNGQVGNARWSGISLSDVLRSCGLRSEAREVVFFGADEARDATGATAGPHGRSVFVQDTVRDDAILATHMNGELLTPDHGFPLRLILPGWYGMAQIKWLMRIEVLDRRYEGLHMSRNYHTLHALPEAVSGPLFLPTSITRMRLKSVVARVTRHPVEGYRILGAAWGGSRPIEKIEVRVDDAPWQTASIVERRGSHGWVLWSHPWKNAGAGDHTLTSRAIDADGNTQPTVAEWSRQIRTAREHNAQWQRRLKLPG
jgi:DMSO/TMAO reductase YedYZ molybdopterin-dependent catalytic subunit